MDEPTRFAIAYWLIPSAPASDYFHELIQHLASRYDAPVFEPHLTLGVGPDYLKEAARKLAGLSHAPVELRATSIAFTSQFTKTLFLRFRPSAALLQLRASLGLKADQAFDPHLSLLYKKMPKEKRAQLAKEIRLPFTSVKFTSVAATRCRLPVASAADVALWRPAGTQALHTAGERS